MKQTMISPIGHLDTQPFPQNVRITKRQRKMRKRKRYVHSRSSFSVDYLQEQATPRDAAAVDPPASSSSTVPEQPKPVAIKLDDG